MLYDMWNEYMILLASYLTYEICKVQILFPKYKKEINITLSTNSTYLNSSFLTWEDVWNIKGPFLKL